MGSGFLDELTKRVQEIPSFRCFPDWILMEEKLVRNFRPVAVGGRFWSIDVILLMGFGCFDEPVKLVCVNS